MQNNILESLLPPYIFEVLNRTGVNTPRQILILSIWDLKQLTNLSFEDIKLLKDVVSDYFNPVSHTIDALQLMNGQLKTATKCISVDNLLDGGFRRGTITEIYGESGSGKTQIGIVTAVNTWPNKSVYICTEGIFPIKRYNQIISNSINVNDIDYGKHVYIQCVTESQELINCVRVNLPKLLESNEVSLIVIDSVAAPFRFENTNYVQRAEDLRELAILLIALAQKYNLAVVTINQVTASFEEGVHPLPSLGLAWSNMVAYRLYLKKMEKKINIETSSYSKPLPNIYNIRNISVEFAPDLPNSTAQFIITYDGIKSIF